MRSSALGLVGLVGLAACNALTGVGDLALADGACVGCVDGSTIDAASDGGGTVGPDGATPDGSAPDAGPQRWGGLDPTFGQGGRATLTGLRAVFGVVVQSDGRILVVGQSTGSDAALLRATATGAPDASFGQAGIVVDGFQQTSELRAVAIDGLARIVVAGNTTTTDANGVHRYGYASRYSAAGARDNAFGVQGRARTVVDSQQWNGLVLDAAGGIYTAGQCDTGGGDLGFFKLTSAGNPELAFAQAGRACHGFGATLDTALGLAAGPNGTLVAAGVIRGGDDAIAVGRVTASNGALDPTFAGGKGSFDLGPRDDRGVAVASLADGSVAVAVAVRVEPAPVDQEKDRADFGVLRLTAAGAPDPAFGVAGRVTTDFPQSVKDADEGDEPSAILGDAAGRILVAGTSLQNGGADIARVVRYTRAGALDPLFADGGVLTLSTPNGELRARAMATTPDGKVVVACEAGADRVELVRFIP